MSPDLSAPIQWIVGVIALLCFSALLALAESALVSYSRAHAQELATQGRPGAKRLVALLEDPPKFTGTLTLLRILSETSAYVITALVLVEASGFSITEAIWGTLALAVAVSFVVISVGVRTLGRQHSDSIALGAAGAVGFVSGLLRPITALLILIGNAITPGKGFSEGPFASEAELRELVDIAEASSLIESEERQMIHSVFELGDTMVREVMVPRTDVVFIERHKSLRQAMSLFLRSGFSRVPVVDDGLDDIIGFAYLKDISKRVFDHKGAESSEQVDSLMRPVIHVPDTLPVDDMLREMQRQRRHIAVAVDEYGGTAGILTIEDILEEIVGEITDEFDDEVGVEHLADGTLRLPSRFPVDDLVDVIGVDIEDEDVDSIGGLMAKHLGRVPLAGARVELSGLSFTAEEATDRRRRITSVLVRKLDQEPD
ncbi:MAG TPA: hemolysin family protein [Marmoricola sp.]|nr:HlyC/CorC family transporter [Nocardioidaceae bacterium]MCO5323686.1 hemolysin family protein [Nocardioidaceae bacterium]HRV68880.1 hemolysin family protein [Marmoricola sp.]